VDAKTSPILIYHPDPVERSRLVRLALLACMAPLIVDSREALIQSILSRKFNVVGVFLDPNDSTLLQALRIFRERNEYRFIQFLIILGAVDRNQVNELIKCGFYNLLSLQQNDASFIEKMIGFLNAANGPSERRQHIRLNLMDYENAKLILNLSNARKVTTQVKNISVGGLGIAFRERLFIRFIVGEVLTDSVLVIKEMDMTVDVRIVGSSDKGLQLQFIDLAQAKTDHIAQFIQERIQYEFA